MSKEDFYNTPIGSELYRLWIRAAALSTLVAPVSKDTADKIFSQFITIQTDLEKLLGVDQ